MESEELPAASENHHITEAEIKAAANVHAEALARAARAAEDRSSRVSDDEETEGDNAKKCDPKLWLPLGHTEDEPKLGTAAFEEHEKFVNKFYFDTYFNPIFRRMLEFFRKKYDNLEQEAFEAYKNSRSVKDSHYLDDIRAQKANIDFYVDHIALAAHPQYDIDYVCRQLSLERARRGCEKSIGKDAVRRLDNVCSKKDNIDMHVVYNEFTKNPKAITTKVLEKATMQHGVQYTQFSIELHRIIFEETVFSFSETFAKTYMHDPVPGAADPVSLAHEEGKCLVGPLTFYRKMACLSLVSKCFNDSVKEYWTSHLSTGFIYGNKNFFFGRLGPIIHQHNLDHFNQDHVFKPHDDTYDGAYKLDIVYLSSSRWLLVMDCRNVAEYELPYAIAIMFCHVFQQSLNQPSVADGGPVFQILFVGPEAQRETVPIYIDSFYADRVINDARVYDRINAFVILAKRKVILNTGHMPLQFIQFCCEDAKLLIGIGMLGNRQIYDDTFNDFFALIGAGMYFTVRVGEQNVICNGAMVDNYLSLWHFTSTEQASKMKRFVVQPDITNEDNRDQTSGNFMPNNHDDIEPFVDLRQSILCTGDGMQVRNAAITWDFLQRQ